MSFMPTDYRGVSELGQIAGVGMLVAYATSITLLPALITVLNPPGEAHPVGYPALAPVDRFLETYRVPVIVGTVAVALLGSLQRRLAAKDEGVTFSQISAEVFVEPKRR